MDDEALGNVWTTLEPTLQQRRRLDAQVFTWIEAHDTPLAAEWVGLFRGAPLPTLGLAALSAVAILAASPLVWFARAFM